MLNPESLHPLPRPLLRTLLFIPLRIQQPLRITRVHHAIGVGYWLRLCRRHYPTLSLAWCSTWLWSLSILGGVKHTVLLRTALLLKVSCLSYCMITLHIVCCDMHRLGWMGVRFVCISSWTARFRCIHSSVVGGQFLLEYSFELLLWRTSLTVTW